MQVHGLAVALLAITTLHGTTGFISKLTTSARRPFGLHMLTNENQLKVSESLAIDTSSLRLVDALNDPNTKQSIGAAEKAVSESIALDVVRSMKHVPTNDCVCHRSVSHISHCHSLSYIFRKKN
jgi:hypothetical protein